MLLFISCQSHRGRAVFEWAERDLRSSLKTELLCTWLIGKLVIRCSEGR